MRERGAKNHEDGDLPVEATAFPLFVPERKPLFLVDIKRVQFLAIEMLARTGMPERLENMRHARFECVDLVYGDLALSHRQSNVGA